MIFIYKHFFNLLLFHIFKTFFKLTSPLLKCSNVSYISETTDYVLIVMKSIREDTSAPRPCFCLSQRTITTYLKRSLRRNHRHHHHEPRRKSLLLRSVSMHFQDKELLKPYGLLVSLGSIVYASSSMEEVHTIFCSKSW